MFLSNLKSAFISLMFFTILTGVIYPLGVTAVGQIIFKSQANGSLIQKDGKIAGSRLIGQNFDDPKYFWGRLSQTNPAYNASFSSGSNWGPLNPALTDALKARIASLKAVDPDSSASVPVDLVTSSGSGLDPHISLAAANYQLPRVAKSRGLSNDAVKNIVTRYTTGRFWGVWGEPVVNVLSVNLALDDIKKE